MKIPKIPKYMYGPVSGNNRYGIDLVRKALEIEAALYRHNGRKDAAVALRTTARILKGISKGTYSTFALAFDWPAEGKGDERG